MGNSGKGVVCARVGCSIKAHRRDGNKMVNVAVGTLFVPAPSKDCCYHTPSVLLSEVAETTELGAFLVQPRSPAQMVRIFTMVSKGNRDQLENLEEEELIAFFGEEKKWAPVTPGKMKEKLQGSPPPLTVKFEEAAQNTEDSNVLLAETLLEDIEDELDKLAPGKVLEARWPS